jgi:hypothetical protein
VALISTVTRCNQRIGVLTDTACVDEKVTMANRSTILSIIESEACRSFSAVKAIVDNRCAKAFTSTVFGFVENLSSQASSTNTTIISCGATKASAMTVHIIIIAIAQAAIVDLQTRERNSITSETICSITTANAANINAN